MTVIQFPRRRRTPPAEASTSLDILLAELTAVELDLARARLAQINQDTRQAGVLWFSYCLKRAVVWGLVLWVVVSCARAEGKQFYNANGSFAGSSVSRGNGASFYDGSGRFSGSSVQQGNATRYYDFQGRYSGSTTTTGPRR